MFDDLYKKLRIESQEDMELLEECIREEIDYLVAEGFVKVLPNGKYRFYTDEEIQKEIDEISL